MHSSGISLVNRILHKRSNKMCGTMDSNTKTEDMAIGIPFWITFCGHSNLGIYI